MHLESKFHSLDTICCSHRRRKTLSSTSQFFHPFSQTEFSIKRCIHNGGGTFHIGCAECEWGFLNGNYWWGWSTWLLSSLTIHLFYRGLDWNDWIGDEPYLLNYARAMQWMKLRTTLRVNLVSSNKWLVLLSRKHTRNLSKFASKSALISVVLY